jgi:hypothetical protein
VVVVVVDVGHTVVVVVVDIAQARTFGKCILILIYISFNFSLEVYDSYFLEKQVSMKYLSESNCSYFRDANLYLTLTLIAIFF